MAHILEDVVEDLCASVASSEPAGIGDAIRSWGTVLDFFEEKGNVLRGGRTGAAPVNGLDKVFGKGFGGFGVDGVFLKGVAPVSAYFSGLLVGGIGGGPV